MQVEFINDYFVPDELTSIGYDFTVKKGQRVKIVDVFEDDSETCLVMIGSGFESVIFPCFFEDIKAIENIEEKTRESHKAAKQLDLLKKYLIK